MDRKYSLINVFFDFLFILIIYLTFEKIIDFHQLHMKLSFFLAIPVHLLTLLIGMILYSLNESKKISNVKIINSFLGVFLGFSIVMVFFSFIWMLFPFFAIKYISGKVPINEILFFIGMLVLSTFVIGYGGSFSENYGKFKLNLPIKLIFSIIVFLFFIYSESLILGSSIILEYNKAVKYGALIWATFTYLPLRTILYFSPPVTILEIISMFSGYLFLVYRVIL